RFKIVRDEGVPRILPLEDRGDGEPGRQLGRQVLHGVHRELRAAVGERVLQLLDEESLAADLVEALVEELVALRRHRQQRDLQSRMALLEERLDVLRLQERETA